MANITKLKRDEMLAYINQLKQLHTDDLSIKALNEIENHLTDKKFGLVFEEHTEEADEKLKDYIPVLCADTERLICKDEYLPYNFIIEGDNLHALHLLEKTHRGKIDCIYIDPPYNTGAKDWKYNNDYVDKEDSYRHSKWLSLMKSRLILAKKLLNPIDSVLIVTIDEKEYFHLGCLLEEIFPNSNIQMISSIIAQKGVARNSSFYRVNEFIYFVQLGNSKVTPLPLSDEWRLGQKESAQSKGIVWSQLRRSGTGDLRTDCPNLFYPIIFNSLGNKIVGAGDSMSIENHPISGLHKKDDFLYLWPIKENGIEGRWQLSQKELMDRVGKGYVKIGKIKENTIPVSYLKRGSIQKIENNEVSLLGIDSATGTVIVDAADYSRSFVPGSQWNIQSHDATYHGSQLLNKIIGQKRFTFPKSLYAVFDVIRFFVENKPNAIILDFFAGSGTTQHAVNLLNKYDNGNRKCIMVTNNEISLEEEKKLTKLGFKKGDPEWEELGIAKYVNWPRTLCSINGVDINGKPLKGDYLVKDATGNVITMSQGFNCNVKYFKCDWVERRPEDYLLSNALSLHIKEMIELQNFIDLDNEKYLLILTKNDFKKFILNNDKKDLIQKVWVNQNIVFDSNEIKELKKYKFKYIPKEFFGQELKEVAE